MEKRDLKRGKHKLVYIQHSLQPNQKTEKKLSIIHHTKLKKFFWEGVKYDFQRMNEFQRET